jgi:hypothetical protein
VGSDDRVLSFGTNGNQNAYIYSSSSLTQLVSTPELRFAVGGLTRLTIASTNGNVGIGTTSPTETLTVAGSTRITGQAANFSTGSPGLNIDRISASGLIRIYSVTGTGSAGDLAFGTNNTERMRITSGGNVLIGKTTDDGRGKLQVSFAKTQEVASFFNTNNASSGDFAIVTNLGINALNTNSYHYIAGTGISDRFYVYGNGTFATVSDQRLKKNISTVKEKYLENVLSLNVVNYNWKDQPDNHSLELGLIAQQVENLFPFIIHENRPDLFGNVYKSVQVSALPYILIKAIQEQQTQIESLKSTLQRNNIL